MQTQFGTRFLPRLCSLALAAFLFCAASPAVFAAEADNTHALHSGPSDLSVVTAKLSDGDTVRILEHTSTDWTRIALEDGTTGYCDSALLSIRGEEDSGDGASDVGETLRPVSILSAPDAEAPAVGKLAANVYITLLSAPEDDAYTEVTVNSQTTGYIDSEAVRPVRTITAVVAPRPTLSEEGAETEAEARETLASLSVYFEDGCYWNTAGVPADAQDAFSITDTPCDHSMDGYVFCNTYSGITETCFPEYGSGSTQCLGYASLLSDLVFGTEAPIRVHYDFDRLRVGDHIRLRSWEHSMVVTEIGTEADGSRYIQVTEVNEDYETCRISWGAHDHRGRAVRAWRYRADPDTLCGGLTGNRRADNFTKFTVQSQNGRRLEDCRRPFFFVSVWFYCVGFFSRKWLWNNSGPRCPAGRPRAFFPHFRASAADARRRPAPRRP